MEDPTVAVLLREHIRVSRDLLEAMHTNITQENRKAILRDYLEIVRDMTAAYEAASAGSDARTELQEHILVALQLLKMQASRRREVQDEGADPFEQPVDDPQDSDGGTPVPATLCPIPPPRAGSDAKPVPIGGAEEPYYWREREESMGVPDAAR